jgi:hypothetical protein
MDNCGYVPGIPVKAGVTYAYEVQRGIHRSSSMANPQSPQQGSGSGTRSNQDPAQKSGSGQQDPSQKSGSGQQGKPNDMNKGGNQPGSGSQHSGGTGGSNR